MPRCGFSRRLLRSGASGRERSTCGAARHTINQRGSTPWTTVMTCAGDPMQTALTSDAGRLRADLARQVSLAIDYGYDGAGRLGTVATPTGTRTCAYNATTGKLSTITGPSNGTLTYSYDGAWMTGE